MGAFLLSAGEPGMRVALTNARIMIHQPSGGAQGMASDIEIQAKEILRIRHRMNELMAKYTGQPVEKIETAVERDKFFSASEAKDFGLVDEVFEKRPGLEDYAGRPVILGIRPSDFEDSTQGGQNWPVISVTVGVTEELGSEINVIFTVDAPTAGVGEATNAAEREEQLEAQGAGFVAGPDQSLWTARVSPKSRVRAGQQMKLAVDVDSLHFFDPETGLSIGDEIARRGAGTHVTGDQPAVQAR